MEKDYIDNMPAGIEMDALIAEKIMGLTISNKNLFDEPGIFVIYNIGNSVACHPPHRYSSDISAAWEVVEKMRSKDAGFEIISHPDGSYFAVIAKEVEDGAGSVEWGGNAIEDTAPLAICRAALKAVQGQKDL